jgi:phenylalanine-4-hydroxylase
MQVTQEDVILSIPSYLRQFVVRQHYEEYTAQDHAVWRYVMRRNLDFLRPHAHPAYFEGLKKTGIGIDRIPHIDEMNEALAKIGWRAVVVDGFVPPAAFMEFQAHRILVISAEIRNAKHVMYTPAPDIIHEAAGHAPIIAEPKYADFLQRFGQYGSKAVFSKADYDIYEAIRYLSILKEFPGTSEADLAAAEADLAAKTAANTNPSESALLSRLHWWTVEYGLMGTPEAFTIFGAGILSSVGESAACMAPSVKKISLSVECATINYDITSMQPQLFVAHDFDHLIDTLEAFADTMSFRTGGVEGAAKVRDSAQVGTLVLDSGLQISGVFSHTDAFFLRTHGETSLAYHDTLLPGHGIQTHSDGFSSPLGRIRGLELPLSQADEGDLLRIGVAIGQSCDLSFSSGYHVKGTLVKIIRKEGNNLLFCFRNCTVTDPSGAIVFQPEWGDYDMAVGEHIVSAYSGSADKQAHNVYPPKSSKTAIKIEYTSEERRLFGLYESIRAQRDAGSLDLSQAQHIVAELDASFSDAWLAYLEIYELLIGHAPTNALTARVHAHLNALCGRDEESDDLIRAGYRFLA